MCGIAGIYAYHYAALEVEPEELRMIRDSMMNRGPDGSGEWFSEDQRVGLGHRRLSIIDLSERAAQPMQSESGKVAISFNGEIYNYRELRKGLEEKGHHFHSDSDTEVILYLYQEKGEEMVHELRGMFAVVIWDGEKKELLLIRDPYGIKPLYYADDGWTVRVASQVRSLLKSPKVSKIPEPAGVAGFYLFGSIPEPYTLYQEIRQVPAGSIVTINQIGPSAPKRYFSIAEVYSKAETFPLTPTFSPSGGEREKPAGENVRGGCDDFVHHALLDSVRHHFVSDVPVGIFLSSGLDSSALVALAREVGIRDLKTITLGFKEFKGTEDDEVPLAEETARRFKTDHITRWLNQKEFEEELSRIFEAMDQPSIDGVNTYFVAKAAKEAGLKVALSGVGGDELFGGYPSFRKIPMLVRAMAVPSRIPFLGGLIRHIFSVGARHASPLRRMNPKYAGLFKYGGTYAGAYFLKRGLFMPWELGKILADPEMAREGLRRLNPVRYVESHLKPLPKNRFARMSVLESSLYLRNQLLRDADWAGMAHSIEIRTPYVDAWLLRSLAPHLVLTGPKKKRDLFEDGSLAIPETVLNRQKTGFSVPFKNWLGITDESGSRSWAERVFQHHQSSDLKREETINVN